MRSSSYGVMASRDNKLKALVQGQEVKATEKKRSIFKKKKTYEDELDEFALFIRMFGFLVRDGYTPDKAVAIMGTTSAGELRRASLAALNKLERGVSMSDAFASTGYFPSEFCAVVGVGESTGSLGDALELYAEYIDKVLQMRKGFRSALTYPTLLLSFVFVMVGVLLFVVAPKFVNMLTEMDVPRSRLPGISAVLFISHEFAELVGMPVIIAGIAFLVYYLMFGPGKNHLMKALGGVPKVKEVNNKLDWSQWLMMGAICLRSGMLLNPMLSTLAGLPLPLELKRRIGKSRLSPTVYEILRKNVGAGSPMSAELVSAKVPNIITQMVGASEKSGRLGEAMKSVAGQYLYSLPADIKAIGTVVEQLAIGSVVIFGGGIVAIVAMTMMAISANAGI